MAMACSSFTGKALVAAKPATRSARRTVATRAVKQDVSKMYVEFGESPYSGAWDNALWGGWAEGKSEGEIKKIAEREIIHGRWAMMGCAGSWAGEWGTGIPWFQAGKVCTPADCSAVNGIFPGQQLALAPIGSGFPSFYNVLGFTVIAMGLSEGYRTGLIEPVFKELEVGDIHPGGEHFDPFNFASVEAGAYDFERFKLAEVKHARLAMLSWLGYMAQAFKTNSGGLPSYVEGAAGPVANWRAHIADPFNVSIAH